ncbi:hypothetical protein D3C81_809430 [compost metagenome]
MADLDADIEGEQRQRQIALRQTDLRQRTGKTEAMQQAKTERHHPWPLEGETGFVTVLAGDFHCQQQNAQRNRRFHRRAGQPHRTQCSECQSDGMGEGECGDGLHQHPAITHQQQESEDEQQVIEAHQDVLDTMNQKCTGHRKRSRRGRDLYPGLRRVDEGGRQTAVQARDTHQHIGDARLQADEFNTLPDQSCGTGFNDPTLDQ